MMLSDGGVASRYTARTQKPCLTSASKPHALFYLNRSSAGLMVTLSAIMAHVLLPLLAAAEMLPLVLQLLTDLLNFASQPFHKFHFNVVDNLIMF